MALIPVDANEIKHNELTNIQGGNDSEQFHLTKREHDVLAALVASMTINGGDPKH